MIAWRRILGVQVVGLRLDSGVSAPSSAARDSTRSPGLPASRTGRFERTGSCEGYRGDVCTVVRVGELRPGLRRHRARKEESGGTHTPMASRQPQAVQAERQEVAQGLLQALPRTRKGSKSSPESPKPRSDTCGMASSGQKAAREACSSKADALQKHARKSRCFSKAALNLTPISEMC